MTFQGFLLCELFNTNISPIFDRKGISKIASGYSNKVSSSETPNVSFVSNLSLFSTSTCNISPYYGNVTYCVSTFHLSLQSVLGCIPTSVLGSVRSVRLFQCISVSDLFHAAVPDFCFKYYYVLCNWNTFSSQICSMWLFQTTFSVPALFHASVPDFHSKY